MGVVVVVAVRHVARKVTVVLALAMHNSMYGIH